ncbi:MAG: NAD-dependent epimerase/dehydratase family protein [Phycisphaerae bacterium]|nr:NAD-dependent epimerase/dehydratase family protein [Phycisphaerae bacterium]
MNALVTGGTGFVGSHLIEQLRAQGDTVRALVRPGSNRRFVKALGAEVATGDLDGLDSLRAACDGCEVVYHAAARVEIVGTEAEFHRTTVAGTARLITAAAQEGVRRFVHVSSCGVYPPALLATGQVIDESTPVTEPPAWFPYGRAKYHAERVVQEKAASEMEWVIVRLGYLYGPRNQTMHSYLEPVMRDKIMMIIGDGTNEMAMTYVEDAVRAIVLAGQCQRAAGKVLIAAGDERVTQQQYFDALADGFGLPHVRKRVSYKVAFLFGWLGELLVHSGPRKAAMRRAAIALTGLPQRLRCDYTRELLGWRPRVRFADGMRKAFDWYHAEYGRGDAGQFELI